MPHIADRIPLIITYTADLTADRPDLFYAGRRIPVPVSRAKKNRFNERRRNHEKEVIEFRNRRSYGNGHPRSPGKRRTEYAR